jgi:proline racemase
LFPSFHHQKTLEVVVERAGGYGDSLVEVAYGLQTLVIIQRAAYARTKAEVRPAHQRAANHNQRF